ncbi:MAG TPA: hypothetical protein VIY27_11255 [Myxococcota bacterium]
MSYAPKLNPLARVLGQQHQAVLSTLDAFDARPSRHTAATVLTTLRRELPVHFALEARAQMPGCVCAEHPGFLRDAISLRPDDLEGVRQLGARIRIHIMREERARGRG